MTKDARIEPSISCVAADVMHLSLFVYHQSVVNHVGMACVGLHI